LKPTQYSVAKMQRSWCLFARAFVLSMACLMSHQSAALPSSSAELAPPHLSFKHILPDQVSTLGYINAVAQDMQGYLWFGGINGVARYDGYQLSVFRHDDAIATSLSHNYVNDIKLTRDGVLWVATRAGIDKFEPSTQAFIHYPIPADERLNLSANDVAVIHEDLNGRLWLGTHNGLYDFNRETNQFTWHDISENASPQELSRVVWSVVGDQDGIIWLGTQTHGIIRFDPAKENFRHFSHQPNSQEGLSFNDVRRLYVDSENHVWAGTYGGGLNRFDRSINNFVRVQHDQADEKGATVWSIIEDHKGNLWVGDGSHINMRPRNSNHFQSYSNNEHDQTSPGNFVVNELFEDRAGNIWAGYFPSGVDVVDWQASVFHNYGYSPTDINTITEGGVLASLEDEQGNVWIGTGYGLNYFNRSNNHFTRMTFTPNKKNSLSGSTVLSVAKDADNNLWLGIFTGGLNKLNVTTGEITHYLPDTNKLNSLHGREAWSVMVDHQQNIWIATDEGLNRFNPRTQQFTYFIPDASQINGEQFLNSRVVYEDRQHHIWLGGVLGLYRLDTATGKFTRFQHSPSNPHSLSENSVLILHEDARGNFWVGTEGGGLNLLDRKTSRFTAYTMKDGLADNVVGGITEDALGNLWIGTQKGISQFSPASGNFHNYDKRHGLADNFYSRNAALTTQSGELFFGNSKGFTLVKPEKLMRNEYVANVVITDLQIGNKSVVPGAKNSPLTKAIGYTSSIRLNYTDVVFSIEFAVLNFHHSDDNQYAYRLLGFEEAWNYVGTRRLATYTNLNPGNYVFEVKGANNDGVWGPYSASLGITILPPFWRTWWAYIIYAGFVLGMLYWFVHVYRLKLRFQIETLAQERLVVKRLTQIDKLKDEFLANTSHELRTPLNGIIGLADSLRDGVAGAVTPKMKYHLSLIVDSGKRLTSLVNDILDFAQLKNKGITLNKKPIDLFVLTDVVLTLSKPLAEAKPLVFINNVPKNLQAIAADEDRVLQILHNLIGNAVKFTDRGVINVTATINNDVVQVGVSDTGTGIPAERMDEIFESFTQLEGGIARHQGGAGLGLSVTKQLVELHGGRVQVESIMGIGSTFYFTLPLSPEVAGLQAAAPAARNTAHYKERNVFVEYKNPDGNPTQNNGSILIVDDDSINRNVIVNFLAMKNYHIIEADCAEVAIKIIKEGEPIDLVLLDIMMPRISGYQACKMLREHYPAHVLPIILLTARSQMNDLVMGFEAGANDFLVKPIAKEELLVRVATHLQLHDVNRNLDKKVAERTDALNKSNAILKQAQHALEAANKKLEEASVSDPLTGLHNRRFLNEFMLADVSIVERIYEDWRLLQMKEETRLPFPQEQDLIFMLLDIDHFKSVNDSYGHSAGDKFLAQLSRLLETVLRDSDYLVRWGGEEFLIVVRYSTREEAPEMAERIRHAVAEHVFDVGEGKIIHKSCSIGVAAFPFYRKAPKALTWEQVVDTADRALYMAKHAGRNCWVTLTATEADDVAPVNPAQAENLLVLAEAGVINIQTSYDA
jgi:two-component system, sensor histidine kinase ChiS